MEQTTTIHATNDFLHALVKQKDQRIQELEQHSQRVTQRDFNTAAELNALREDLKEFTLNELQNNDITAEQAEKLAVIGGFELSKEFDVEVTVQYSITVNALNEEQAINAIHDIDFDSVSYFEPVSYLSSSIDNIEI
jgi:ribosomal protein L15